MASIVMGSIVMASIVMAPILTVAPSRCPCLYTRLHTCLCTRMHTCLYTLCIHTCMQMSARMRIHAHVSVKVGTFAATRHNEPDGAAAHLSYGI